MREERNDFLGLLCNMYIVALLAVLPLYVGDGFGQLGITKYVLFRNISLLCLGCWLVLGMPGRIRSLAKAWRRAAGKKGRGTAGNGASDGRKLSDGRRLSAGGFSMVDCAVAAYGICVLLSALHSPFVRLAWTGYEEWYMGAFSQLMFVGIYFFVSRQYNGAGWPLYLGEAAIFLVSVFGLLHKLGIDPLGLQRGWNSGDWVYNHMLSTLGNINWLCGFYSVALAFIMDHYLRAEKPLSQIPLYLSAVAAFVLLGVQGSQGGLLIIVVCVGVCAAAGWSQATVLKKLFLVLMVFFLCMPLIDLLMDLRGKMAAVVVDGNIFEKTIWYQWLAAGAVCGGLSFFFHVRRESWQDGRVKRQGFRKDKAARQGKIRRDGVSRRWGRVLLVCFGVCLVCLGFLFAWNVDDSFGSGRGFLWHIAMESFGQADLKEKMLGAGPDCFGAAVFARLGAGTDVWSGEYWDGSVFTNAHNEVLSQLCNVGILGTASYGAIFITGLRRYRRTCVGWLGLLAVTMYGAHAMISFQQVLNAPILFLALGLCEYEMRRLG